MLINLKVHKGQSKRDMKSLLSHCANGSEYKGKTCISTEMVTVRLSSCVSEEKCTYIHQLIVSHK